MVMRWMAFLEPPPTWATPMNATQLLQNKLTSTMQRSVVSRGWEQAVPTSMGKEQIKQLEGVFRECPHPDAKLRQDLSERLGMSALQVKFWFQNQCKSKKSKMQRRETKDLQVENQMLKAEKQAITSAMKDKTCLKCRGEMVQTQNTSERQRLYAENMRLKEELLHATTYLKEGLQRNGMWPLCARD